MNEDYLWNKTGDDAETKRLEEVLTVFRYQESEAPALPVAKAANSKSSVWKLSFAFSFATCVAAVILLNVWFQNSNGDLASLENSPAVPAEAGIQPQTESGEDRTNVSSFDKDENAHRTTGRNARVRRSVSLIPRKRTVENSADPLNAAKLTKEEKYAYDQLMLALSITTEKLKIVQDKIHGVENRRSMTNANER